MGLNILSRAKRKMRSGIGRLLILDSKIKNHLKSARVYVPPEVDVVLSESAKDLIGAAARSDQKNYQALCDSTKMSKRLKLYIWIRSTIFKLVKPLRRRI